MSAAEHERFRDDVGAYLLGALDEGEQREFERHAATCHVCQDEIERLRVAADALPRSVEQYAAPPRLRRALMEQVHAEATAPGRRRPRRRLSLKLPRLAAAAAAAALVVGVLAGHLLSPGTETHTFAAAVNAAQAPGALAKLVETGGGARLEVSGMPRLAGGRVYEIWLKRGPRVDPGPLFSVDSRGNGVGAVPSSLKGVDAVMVTRERAGGATRPSEAPLVVATTS